MIKLLASDLDGTIVYNNEITAIDLEAVQKLKQTEVKFVVCTGKTYAMTKDICHQLKPAYGIFGNGTQVMNIQTEEEIIRNTITNTQVLDCLEIAKKYNLHIHIYTNDKIIAQEKLNYMAYRNYILYKDQVQFKVVESLEKYIQEKNPNILKLVISSKKDLEWLFEQVSQFFGFFGGMIINVIKFAALGYVIMFQSLANNFINASGESLTNTTTTNTTANLGNISYAYVKFIDDNSLGLYKVEEKEYSVMPIEALTGVNGSSQNSNPNASISGIVDGDYTIEDIIYNNIPLLDVNVFTDTPRRTANSK